MNRWFSGIFGIWSYGILKHSHKATKSPRGASSGRLDEECLHNFRMIPHVFLLGFWWVCQIMFPNKRTQQFSVYLKRKLGVSHEYTKNSIRIPKKTHSTVLSEFCVFANKLEIWSFEFWAIWKLGIFEKIGDARLVLPIYVSTARFAILILPIIRYGPRRFS